MCITHLSEGLGLLLLSLNERLGCQIDVAQSYCVVLFNI